jgi:ELP3 family radical SAM enzyme/protein acetyltransferase
MTDIEDIVTSTHDNPRKMYINNRNKNKDKLTRQLVKELIERSNTETITLHNINENLRQLSKKYRHHLSKNVIRNYYIEHFSDIKLVPTLMDWLVKCKMRKDSGVLVVTVVLAPSWNETKYRKSSSFSCSKKCSYCPTETDLEGNPTQPKSYLSAEPAMLRATQYNFSVYGQISDRYNSYTRNGIISLDELQNPSMKFKTEIIVSGGTWECYPKDYRDSVIQEIYWSCNVYGDKESREMKSLEEEIKINEGAKFRVVGMTLETRPDFINKYSIRDYRLYGVTRIQIGVQHYDDDILDKIKRECYTRDTIRAIRLLKQVGLKVVVHLMPDLPGSSPEKDMWMFKKAIHDPDLQFDDVKIYPTAVCKSHDDNLIVKSDIADWYNSGEYKPYSENNLNDLIKVLEYYLTNMKPWVRIQRLVRDIPAIEIEAGYNKTSNLRQIINDKLKREKKKTLDIRSMEIKNRTYPDSHTRMSVYDYIASKGAEYHISVEAHSIPWYLDTWYLLYLLMYLLMYLLNALLCFHLKIPKYYKGNTNTYEALYGFCRLRLDMEPGGDIFPELNGCALIREVHVYGSSICVNSNHSKSQHKGYGMKMVRMAEEIARDRGFKKIAVIAGIGTREYYAKKMWILFTRK